MKHRLTVFHPESPGMRVPVVRGFWGRLFKPRHFATDSEVSRYYDVLHLTQGLR